MGLWGQVSTALPWVPSTSSLLPAPASAFHSSSSPSKGVSSLFQQPPGHCIPSSNPNKYVGVWWVFFLTGRPRTSECGFWFQVFPTFWPTLLSPTALGCPASLQLSHFAKPWLWLGNRRLHAALLGCHPLWVPWISQQECFKKAKPVQGRQCCFDVPLFLYTFLSLEGNHVPTVPAASCWLGVWIFMRRMKLFCT